MKVYDKSEEKGGLPIKTKGLVTLPHADTDTDLNSDTYTMQK